MTKRDKVIVDLLKKCNKKLEKLIKDGIFFTLLTAVTVYWYIWDDNSQAGGGKEKLILLSLLPLAHVFKCTNKAHFSALGETVMWCSGASAHTGSAVDCAMQWARDRIEGVLQFLNSRTSPSVLSNGVRVTHVLRFEVSDLAQSWLSSGCMCGGAKSCPCCYTCTTYSIGITSVAYMQTYEHG